MGCFTGMWREMILDEGHVTVLKEGKPFTIFQTCLKIKIIFNNLKLSN